LRGESGLRWFDTSQVHVLELHDLKYARAGLYAAAVSQALRSSPQLRGLQLKSRHVLHPRMLQAVAACSHLTNLHLAAIWEAGPSAADSLAALAQGCSRLRRLTLQGIELLSPSMLPALMQLPCLRLLRLLGCSEAVGQEQCQALTGRLGLQELQVDVMVAADGLLRAGWMTDRLAEGWRKM
jgi:hypothetical protein